MLLPYPVFIEFIPDLGAVTNPAVTKKPYGCFLRSTPHQPKDALLEIIGIV